MQSRPLKTNELREPLLSAAIATKMAQFHGMEMPFTKEPHWLFGTMERYLKQIQDLPPAGLSQMNLLEMYGLKDEMDSLRKLLDSTPSPVVFCHNDIQEGKGKEGIGVSQPKVRASEGLGDHNPLHYPREHLVALRARKC